MIRRQWGLIVLDIVMSYCGGSSGLILRFEGDTATLYRYCMESSIPMAVLGVFIFAAYKMYINLGYASIDEFLTVIAGVSTYCLAVYIVFQFIPDSLPRSIYVLQWFILVALSAAPASFSGLLILCAGVQESIPMCSSSGPALPVGVIRSCGAS